MPVATTLPPPPTRPRAEAGGGGSDWVALTRARDDIDAHLLVGRLNEAGVETRTLTEVRAPGAWLVGGSNPWAPVTVFVLRRQLDDARLVLAEIALAWDAPRRAPARGITTTWWVVAVALGVVLTALAVMQAAAGGSAFADGNPYAIRLGSPL
jgi:hypothetical protein